MIARSIPNIKRRVIAALCTVAAVAQFSVIIFPVEADVIDTPFVSSIPQGNDSALKTNEMGTANDSSIERNETIELRLKGSDDNKQAPPDTWKSRTTTSYYPKSGYTSSTVSSHAPRRIEFSDTGGANGVSLIAVSMLLVSLVIVGLRRIVRSVKGTGETLEEWSTKRNMFDVFDVMLFRTAGVAFVVLLVTLTAQFCFRLLFGF